MRCVCCNKILSYKESTSRFETAPDEPRRYTESCMECLKHIGVPVIYRHDVEEDGNDDGKVEDFYNDDGMEFEEDE